MEVSAHRAFQMLKSLAYVRLSASPEEAKAAEVLKNACEEAGVDVHIEEFSVACGKVNHAKLVVTAPYHKVTQFPVLNVRFPRPKAAWMRSSTTPRIFRKFILKTARARL